MCTKADILPAAIGVLFCVKSRTAMPLIH